MNEIIFIHKQSISNKEYLFELINADENFKKSAKVFKDIKKYFKEIFDCFVIERQVSWSDFNSPINDKELVVISRSLYGAMLDAKDSVFIAHIRKFLIKYQHEDKHKNEEYINNDILNRLLSENLQDNWVDNQVFFEKFSAYMQNKIFEVFKEAKLVSNVSINETKVKVGIKKNIEKALFNADDGNDFNLIVNESLNLLDNILEKEIDIVTYTKDLEDKNELSKEWANMIGKDVIKRHIDVFLHPDFWGSEIKVLLENATIKKILHSKIINIIDEHKNLSAFLIDNRKKFLKRDFDKYQNNLIKSFEELTLFDDISESISESLNADVDIKKAFSDNDFDDIVKRRIENKSSLTKDICINISNINNTNSFNETILKNISVELNNEIIDTNRPINID